jgi:hypothetical protein
MSAFFLLFLIFGPLSVVDLGLSETAKPGWDALLCLACFVQHSGMVRRSYRRWLARFIPSHYYVASNGCEMLSTVVTAGL